jgi:DNA-binding transcriptional LysR family regulator
MKSVSLKQLRSVAAITRTGRIVSAAKELNLTTPAITSQLKLLETELGMTLFDRTRKGMRPTAAGWEVFRTASRIADLLQECEDRLDDLRGLHSGLVTVGVVSTGKYFAPQMMGAFRRAHPHIELHLIVGNREVMVEALRDYSVDIAIMGRPPGDFEVDATLLGEHPLIVIASPEHPLAGRSRIGVQELAGERFLIREEGSGTRASFEAFFANVARPEHVGGMEIGSNETIKQAVIGGLGIALISGHTVAAELADGRLTALDVTGLPIKRQWFIVHRADRSLSTAAAAFQAFLREKGPDYLPPARLFDTRRPAAA